MPSAGEARETFRRTSGHLALVCTQLCFGLFPIFGRWVFAPGGFTPLAVAGWRVLSGGLVLGALAFAVHGRRAWPARQDLPRMAVCALLGVVLNQALFLEGLRRSTAVNAGLIMCLIPVFTLLLATLARLEQFDWVRALGVAIALLGALPLLLARGVSLTEGHGLGNLLMVVNTLAYSGYIVVSKPLLGRYPALVVIAWVYLLSTLSVPFFALGGPMGPAQDSSPQVMWSLAYILVFPTSVGYLLHTFALSRVRASTTAIYVYLQPMITGTASYLLLGEAWDRGTVPAAVALAVGIWLITRRRAGAVPGTAKLAPKLQDS